MAPRRVTSLRTVLRAFRQGVDERSRKGWDHKVRGAYQKVKRVTNHRMIYVHAQCSELGFLSLLDVGS